VRGRDRAGLESLGRWGGSGGRGGSLGGVRLELEGFAGLAGGESALYGWAWVGGESCMGGG